MLGALASITLALGFLIQWVTLTHLGPGIATDALFAALAIPQLLIVVVGNPIVHVLVPLLSTEKEPARGALAWTFFLGAAGVLGLLVILLSLSTRVWVPVTVAGFPPAGKTLAAALAVIQLPGVVLMAMGMVLRSVNHAGGKFIWTACAASLAAAASFLFLLWALPRLGIQGAAWSYTLRAGLEMVLLLPALGRPRRPAWGKPVRQFLLRFRPLVLGSLYERTEIILDRFLASLTPAGGLSLFYLGQQVWGAVGQVINHAMAAPIVPELAQTATGGNWLRYRGLVRTRLTWVLILTTMLVGGMAAFGEPVLIRVFGIRNVTPEDVRILWLLLLLLSGLLVGNPSSHLLLTSFYATGDTRTPTKIGMASYTIGAVCKLAGFAFFGLFGLAAGTSVYYLLRSWMLFHALRRRIPLPPLS